MLDALKQKSVRVTPQRAEIIRILSREDSHPGAGAVLRKAREMMPQISASTVYYTLGLLKKEDLIKELQFYDMENRYESELTDHIDLICTNCGGIENLYRELPVSPGLIEQLTGFKAHRMRFEYYGLCGSCAGKQE